MSELEEICADLGDVYFINKISKDELSKLRSEFFEKATETFAPESLAKKTVKAPVVSHEDAKAFAAKYNPGWRVVEVEEGTPFDEGFSVIIEEDPAFIGFTQIVQADEPIEIKVKDEIKTYKGYAITKTIRSGSPILDDDRLKEEDPQFWLRITEWQNEDVLKDMIYEAGVEPEDVEDYINDWLEGKDWPRVLISIDEWSKEDTELIKQYTYESPKTVALNVRYAKDDEL